MLHRDIITKWIGKPVKEPGYKVECVAWVKKYCEERGYAIKAFGGSAWNGWKTGIPFNDSWVRFTYKPGMYPRQGDIVFWSESRVKYGHVAVANSHCNVNLLRYSDTNGRGKGDPVTNRFTGYENVVGWISKLDGK